MRAKAEDAGLAGTCWTGGVRGRGAGDPRKASVGTVGRARARRLGRVVSGGWKKKRFFFSSLNRNRDGVGLFHWWG